MNDTVASSCGQPSPTHRCKTEPPVSKKVSHADAASPDSSPLKITSASCSSSEAFSAHRMANIPPLAPTFAADSAPVRIARATQEKLRVDRSYIPLENLEYIKKIFEAYDFVKTGKSEKMDVEVRRMRIPTEKPKRRDLLNRRRDSQQMITDEVEGDRMLPNLRVDDAETNAKRRRLLLFGLIHTRPGIDSEHREDGQDECLLDMSSEEDSEEENVEVEDSFLDYPAAQRVYERETKTALHHIHENQKVVDAEIEKMETWKVHQRMLRAEAKANREVNALANIVAPTVPLPLAVIPSSAGIPFIYFAQQVVARYFNCFFPINHSGPKEFQPRRRQHIKAVKELFRLMDTNADDLVSWDEFSAHILQAGQRHILETELRRAAAKAAASTTGQMSSRSIDAQKSGAGSMTEIDLEQEKTDAPPEVNVEYELTFTPEPTNSSSWQATYPLVHHLYHEEPITKMVVSERSRRYITGGPDGLLKLWKPDPRLLDSQHRMAIVHERNLVCTRAAITDMALSSISMGDAEVVAASAMDGTITLMRTSTGEVVRTLLGVRGAEESGVAVLNDIAARGADREKKEFEEDDLLSLRNRQPVVAGTVVRMPYTVPAYHDDMMEIFFGKTNRYFQGLDVVAPTYTHLKRPVASSSDILYGFGAEKLLKRLSERGMAPETTRKCWFATSLALGRCNPLASNAVLKDGAYLVLGFEAGVVQVYELSMNWFCVTQISATRVEPPSARKPIHSFLVHDAAVSGIIISEADDLIITSSDDGTLQVRQFSRLNHPHIILGEGIPNHNLVPPMLRQLRNKRSMSVNSTNSAETTNTNTISSHSTKGNDPSGHTKRITCMCLNVENHLIVSGGMDHCVVFWTTRSHRLIRQIDIRDMQNTVQGLADLGSCGYPIDLCFMERSRDPLRLIVLDSKRVIRLLNALNGSFMGVLVDQSPSSLALGDMLVARYERFDDRLLLGARCVRAWDIPRDEEYARDYFGHKKPVIFMGMDPTLKLFVTADDENIVMWNFSLIPYELALQRRTDRRLNRERARVKARKDAEKRRALRMARKARAALLAAEEAERKAKESQAQTPRHTQATSILDMNLDDDDDVDEDEEAERARKVNRLLSCCSHDEDSEEEEIATINATAYEDEIPFIHHLDVNQYNLTYWRTASRVVRTWKVEGGVRSVSMETSTRAGGIYVALLREKAIVQYNSFNGAALRKFVFPETACDVYSLCAGEAILNQTENALAPLLCGAFEEDAKNGLASIYHLNHGGGDPDSAFKRELQEEAELEARGRSIKRNKEPGAIRAHRNLLVKGAACTSVAVLPSLGVVVIGGRNSVSYSPIMETTTHAIQCTNLQEEPPKERKREREAAIRAANLALFGGSYSDTITSTMMEEWRAPVNLMALFPGRLVVDPTAEGRQRADKSKLHQVHHRASTNSPDVTFGDEVESRDPGLGKTPAPDDEDGGGEEKKADDTNPSTTGIFYEDGQREALGYVGHIVPVRDLGYVFTATNDGLLQLWNIRSSSEVLRFKATLRVETITSLSISCYGARKTTHGGPEADLTDQGSTTPSHGVGTDTTHSLGSGSFSRPSRRNVLKDSYYVAVGDQSGYVLLLDFNELPWEEEVPLDVIPRVETKVLVLDRWRAHRHDVRGVCFVGNPEVRGSDLVGHEYQAGLRRCFADDGTELSPMQMAARDCSAPCTSHPITIVTTGEDTYTYVWSWEFGTLNCLGCFGGGVLSPITPPLTQLPKKSLLIFETARRQYVLQRLVMGYKFFQTHNVQTEIDSAIREMERDATRLAEDDPAWRMSFWGSLTMLTGDRLPYRETLWSSPRKNPDTSEISPVFDVSGFKGMRNRLYQCPNPRPETSEPVRRVKSQSNMMVADPASEAYAMYVFAFMRGTYEDESVRECLFRVVKDLRPRIKKIIKRGRRRASGQISQMPSMSKHRFSQQSTVSGEPEAGTECASPTHDEGRAKNSISFTEEDPSAPSAPMTPGTTLTAVAPPPPFGELKPEDLGGLTITQGTSEGGESSEAPGDVSLRGALGVPMYKVDYKQPALAKEVHYTAFKQGSESQQFATKSVPPGTVDAEQLADQLPHIIMEEHRLNAIQGNPVSALSTRRLSFSEGHGRSGAKNAGLVENLEEAAMGGECATVIMERSYIGRRREDAIRQILRDQIEADIPASAAKEKAQEIQLSIDAGLIAIDTYQDFSTTKTTNVLFDKEKVLVEPTTEVRTKIPESFLKTVMPGSFNIKQMGEMREIPQSLNEDGSPKEDDWYIERDKIKRQRHFQDSLWAPSRIVQTLMNWESPIPPHLRQQSSMPGLGRGSASAPSSARPSGSGAPRTLSSGRGTGFSNTPRDNQLATKPMSSDGEPRLVLPHFLPDHLFNTPKGRGGPGDLESHSRETPGSTVGISESNPQGSHTSHISHNSQQTQNSLEESGNVWDTALDYNKGKLNLNALVASEVSVLKSIAKKSLEDRENFVKQQKRQQEAGGDAVEVGEEEADGGRVTSPVSTDGDNNNNNNNKPTEKKKPSEPSPNSWIEQSRPRTLTLSEVKKRMIKPSVTIAKQ